jgi:hypothetical protein
MTLTDDTGKPVPLHPLIASMISVLVEKQEGIWKRRAGVVQLHFAAVDITLKVFDPPVFTASRKMQEKPGP